MTAGSVWGPGCDGPVSGRTCHITPTGSPHGPCVGHLWLAWPRTSIVDGVTWGHPRVYWGLTWLHMSHWHRSTHLSHHLTLALAWHHHLSWLLTHHLLAWGHLSPDHLTSLHLHLHLHLLLVGWPHGHAKTLAPRSHESVLHLHGLTLAWWPHSWLRGALSVIGRHVACHSCRGHVASWAW